MNKNTVTEIQFMTTRCNKEKIEWGKIRECGAIKVHFKL